MLTDIAVGVGKGREPTSMDRLLRGQAQRRAVSFIVLPDPANSCLRRRKPNFHDLPKATHFVGSLAEV